jgi:hypothetical protein
VKFISRIQLLTSFIWWSSISTTPSDMLLITAHLFFFFFSRVLCAFIIIVFARISQNPSVVPPVVLYIFLSMCCTLLTRLTSSTIHPPFTSIVIPPGFLLFFLIICLRVFPSLCVQSKGEAGNAVYLIAIPPNLYTKIQIFSLLPTSFFFRPFPFFVPCSRPVCSLYSLIEAMMYDMPLSFFVYSHKQREEGEERKQHSFHDSSENFKKKKDAVTFTDRPSPGRIFTLVTVAIGVSGRLSMMDHRYHHSPVQGQPDWYKTMSGSIRYLSMPHRPGPQSKVSHDRAEIFVF